MQKDIIKQGFDAAEKEHQEEQVKKIKEIVQAHLEKIDYHSKQAKEHQEKSTLLKKELEDLKAGRLDKIAERHEKDSKAREVRVIEIHKIEREYIPMYPWRSPWQIVFPAPMYPLQAITSGTSTITLLGNNTNAFTSIQTSATTLTGVQCSNFTGGTYSVNGNTITL